MLSAGSLHICRRGVLVLFSFVLIDQQREIPEHSTLKVFHLTTAKGLIQLYSLDVSCMTDKWEADEWHTTCSLLLCLPHTSVSWRLILLRLVCKQALMAALSLSQNRKLPGKSGRNKRYLDVHRCHAHFRFSEIVWKDQEAKRKERCDLVDWALRTQQWLIKVVSHEYPSTGTILWSQ